jgi:hypothetical protein
MVGKFKNRESATWMADAGCDEQAQENTGRDLKKLRIKN